MKKAFILSAVLVGSSIPVTGQEQPFPHPQLSWQTIETEHFLIHFHEGAERSAREIAVIAEEIYGPITRLYGHEPDGKVNFVVRDHDDYSNGIAYFYDNKIEIWAPALDFELRGTHPWLRDVVTHEFTHIVQIQTAMKLGRKIPAVYFQWLGYEAERRTDVLYGYPNIIVSYPLSAFVIPTWFAEGVAQYNHPGFRYDYWDTHRDMILRMYMLEGEPLGWEEMAVFGKTSLGNESSYNAGFSIVDHIAAVYGVERLNELSRALSSLPRVTIDGAIKAVLGKTGRELYDEWKRSKRDHYRRAFASVLQNRIEGQIIEPEGFGNFFPAFSPDGKQIAYVSNKGEDYFSVSFLYLHDRESGRTRKLNVQTRSTLSFSPDGRYLYYSKATRRNPFWSRYSDLFRYDLQSEKEVRLTHALRAWHPRLSGDGTKLVFVTGRDGTANIAVADADGGNVRRVTHFSSGEQCYTPAWSPDGSLIAFGFSTGHGQSLAMVNADGSDFRIVAAGPDSRNPCFSSDGRFLYFSSDEGGTFNIRMLDLQSQAHRQVTNVLGGAFTPAVNDSGDIVFSLYTANGYKISSLKGLQLSPGAVEGTLNPDAASEPLSDVNGETGETAESRSITFSARRTEKVGRVASTDAVGPARSYRNVFTSLTLVPLLRVDNYNPRNKGIDIVRPGVYFSSSDMLEKLSLFGGAAVNRKLERDLFLILDYRDAVPGFYQLGLDPTLSFELYNISRKTVATFPIYTDREYFISTDVTYNLFEFDFLLRQKVINEFTSLTFSYTLSRYSADIGAFVIPPAVGLSPGFRSEYLIGNAFSLQLKHENLHPSVDRDINPVGRNVTLKYGYEFNKFNPEGEYEIENGLLVPQYSKPSFHRVEFHWTEHLRLPVDRHTLTLGFRRSSILRKQVDDFFDFYAGGFAGMRGYPFYSLGGNDIATVSITYRFPISTRLNTRVLQFYFTKLYGSFFTDAGEAWRGRMPPVRSWKKDAGFELRLEAFSFYQYPTRIFFSGAYGWDRFSKTFDNVRVTYGREWRFYLGLLFGFELSQMGRFIEHANDRTR